MALFGVVLGFSGACKSVAMVLQGCCKKGWKCGCIGACGAFGLCKMGARRGVFGWLEWMRMEKKVVHDYWIRYDIFGFDDVTCHVIKNGVTKRVCGLG